MKYITTFLKRFLPKELPKPVGRWSIENCNLKTNQRVDLSNEDHCGPCGQYALKKTIHIKNKSSTINLLDLKRTT